MKLTIKIALFNLLFLLLLLGGLYLINLIWVENRLFFSIIWTACLFALKFSLELLIVRKKAFLLTTLSLLLQKISQRQAKLQITFKSKKRDETGTLINHLNAFFGFLVDLLDKIIRSTQASIQISQSQSLKIQKTLESLSKITQNIKSSKTFTDELVEQIDKSYAAISNIIRNIAEFSGEIEKQSRAVSETSLSIEKMSASVKEVSLIARERSQFSERLSQISHSGAQQVKATNAFIGDISQNIDNMFGMIKLINKIAFQTNLLAMNAAIEAAHAGDYGRGFAVVADEIRVLAESTAANAKYITITLKGLISKINLALTASQESGSIFNQILVEVEAVLKSFNDISHSAVKLFSGTEDILGMSTSLKEISRVIDIGIGKVEKESIEIADSLGRIKQISDRSLSSIDTINSQTEEINSSMADITHFTISNNHAISEIQSIVGALLVHDNSSTSLETLDFTTAHLMKDIMNKSDNLGRKIVFLLPAPILLKQNIILEMIKREYEIYAFDDLDHTRDFVKKNQNSLLFVNIDAGYTLESWQDYIRGIMSSPDTASTQIGVMSERDNEEIIKLFLMELMVPCGYICLKADNPRENISIITKILEANEARGRRRYVRAKCEGLYSLKFKTYFQNQELNGNIIDISSVSFSCQLREDTTLPINTVLDPIRIEIQDEEIAISGIVVDYREKQNIYIVIFNQGIPEKVKDKIHIYINHCLQNIAEI